MFKLCSMLRSGAFAAMTAALLSACAPAGPPAAQTDPAAQVARGKYLVSVIGCTDCHTPGGLTPKPDMARYLGGSDIAFSVPGMGASRHRT